ncbi:non-ribosomal peptide synthetase [Nonomuraea sp. NPDC046570]|uniref:non-ribosomal peptide synthetase n=1 Tax=Nonomuraea sp. NPDC046570 TaxID=3155255 RepID=UPI0033EA3BD5
MRVNRPHTMHRLFAQQAATTPDATALVVGQRRTTYRELDIAANALAQQLHAEGVGRGHVVAVSGRHPDEMVTGMLGVLKAGAAYLPLDPDYPAERLELMLADSRASLVVTGSDVTSPGGGLSIAAGQAEDEPDAGVGPDDMAYLIYTSGSTGRPKGVEVPHRAVTALATGLRGAVPVDRVWAPGASSLLASSFSFDTSVKSLVLLFAGVTLHMLEPDQRRDIGAVATYVREHRIDSFLATPTQLRLWLEEGILDSAPAHPVHVMVGGEAIGPDLWARLRDHEGVTTTNHYGPTECTVNATVAPVAGPRPVLGHALPGVELHVLDAARQPVPDGVVGELCIGGTGVADGYRDRPEETVERFLIDALGPGTGRIYRTGDLVRRVDGELEFMGRADEQVKIRGFRIEPGEIEAVLAQHPQVRDAVVLARQEDSGTQLVAYLTAAEGTWPTARDFREHLLSTLPEYMVPGAFVLLDQLPTGPNGKLDCQTLPAPGSELSDQFVAPRTPREEALAEIWSRVLGLPSVGVFDNFFDLGGHSLLAAKIISRVRKELGASLTLRTVIESPTIAELAVQLDAAKPAPPAITAMPEVR